MKMLAVLLFLIAMVPNVSSTMLTTRSARINKACKDENWLGDGNCDPGNNNEGCGWDKFRDVSDCCKGPMAMKNCKDEKLCRCLDPSFPRNRVTTRSARINRPCRDENRLGDGNCDPGNDNRGCGWDKIQGVSDCCKGLSAMKNCKDEKLCKCLDPSYSGTIPTTSKTTSFITLILD